MTVNYEKTSTNEGVLHFTIAHEDAVKAMQQAYKRIQKDVSIPGFRKGKVNYKMFTQMYGEASLYEDALNILLPSEYPKAVEEAGLDVVTQPQFDVDSIEKGKDWEVQAKVATKPAVKLGQFKDLEVSKQDREVTDEEVDQRLAAAQNKLSELVLKEGPAEKGDTVVIDFEGFKDGEAFEGGAGQNHSLELGSDSFIPGFEDQLIGAKEDDEVEVKVTFPEDYQAEDLAGQDAIFKVTVHEVKAKEVPELDDEFAKDVDEEVDTLDELTAKYRKELEEAKNKQADEAMEEEALRQAVENAEIDDLPHAMVHEEVHRQMDHYLNEMQRQGISPELYYQITGTSEADLHKQFEEDADVRVKTNLILEQIVKDEEIEASDEDVENEIQSLADNYNMDADQVRNIITEDMLKNDIALKKAMEVITESAKEV
ncbi:trigger factor [Aerococcus kribbianus]|uniref:Trigger factor n=1 Tax=Aerococcus kribbianus TaxID=2999064 RepID=A0A9X3JEL5_9LACT|nr:MULTISPECIES: trigger factor [unclassified Aerococcus]MCZ0716733.1 trigger factor [Aerococcus sp. YH-aer221]MCZ0725021.1 trigger factor [Aerococcus sp. YH-aer222]